MYETNNRTPKRIYLEEIDNNKEFGQNLTGYYYIT